MKIDWMNDTDYNGPQLEGLAPGFYDNEEISLTTRQSLVPCLDLDAP